MLEIIILFFLTKKIGVLAVTKGLRAGKWKLNLVLAWIAAELLGAMVGVIIFGADNLFSCLLLALGFAVTSYILIKNYLTRLPY